MVVAREAARKRGREARTHFYGDRGEGKKAERGRNPLIGLAQLSLYVWQLEEKGGWELGG